VRLIWQYPPGDALLGSFGPGSSAKFSTVKTVTLRSQSDCYFDTRAKFPASGAVRLIWQYPPGDALLGSFGPGQGTIYSRHSRSK
jgi:hypothetical protein